MRIDEWRQGRRKQDDWFSCNFNEGLVGCFVKKKAESEFGTKLQIIHFVKTCWNISLNHSLQCLFHTGTVLRTSQDCCLISLRTNFVKQRHAAHDNLKLYEWCQNY